MDESRYRLSLLKEAVVLGLGKPGELGRRLTSPESMRRSKQPRLSRSHAERLSSEGGEDGGGGNSEQSILLL